MCFLTFKLKIEAEKLRNVKAGDVLTRVIAIGIGTDVSRYELNDLASSPQDEHVIILQDTGQLSDVEKQLRNTSCTGR